MIVIFFSLTISTTKKVQEKKKRIVQFVQHYPLPQQSNTKVDISFTLVALNI